MSCIEIFYSHNSEGIWEKIYQFVEQSEYLSLVIFLLNWLLIMENYLIFVIKFQILEFVNPVISTDFWGCDSLVGRVRLSYLTWLTETDEQNFEWGCLWWKCTSSFLKLSCFNFIFLKCVEAVVPPLPSRRRRPCTTMTRVRFWLRAVSWLKLSWWKVRMGLSSLTLPRGVGFLRVLYFPPVITLDPWAVALTWPLGRLAYVADRVIQYK